MRIRETDVAILGAGTAGLTSRRAAEKRGARALLIDPGPFGTTCARVGCMPSKLLIAAADAAHEARRAGVFGVNTGEVTVDGRAVLARVQRERDRFVGFVLRSVDGLEAEGKLIRGRGRLVEPGVVQVDDHTRVHAKSIIVATGSSPFVPPPFRGLGPILMGNDDIFELEDLPESVLVAGTGVIGLELGQALHRLGVRVTIVGLRGRVGPLSDPKVTDSAREVLGAELDLVPDYTLRSVEATDAGARVRFRTGAGEERDGTWERVLIAAGRRPNVRGLGLELEGVRFDERGGLASAWDHRTCQLDETRVFLAGDVNSWRPLLHEAADEGHIAGANAALYPAVLAHPRRASLGVVFSDPQIAVVGVGWSALTLCDVNIGEVDYGDQGRSRVMNKNAGRVRIYGRREDGVLLGAEMFGPRVEHTAHLLAWAIQQRLTVDQALAMPFYHPVVEEGIRTALRDLQNKLKFAPPAGEDCEEVGPGA